MDDAQNKESMKSVVELNREISKLNTGGLIKSLEMLHSIINKGAHISFPINSVIIGNRKFKDIDEIDLNTFDTINDC